MYNQIVWHVNTLWPQWFEGEDYIFKEEKGGLAWQKKVLIQQREAYIWELIIFMQKTSWRNLLDISPYALELINF